VTTCPTCIHFLPHHPGAWRGSCAWIDARAMAINADTGVWVLRRSVGSEDGVKCKQWKGKEMADEKA
jgi:hypothetical protein